MKLANKGYSRVGDQGASSMGMDMDVNITNMDMDMGVDVEAADIMMG